MSRCVKSYQSVVISVLFCRKLCKNSITRDRWDSRLAPLFNVMKQQEAHQLVVEAKRSATKIRPKAVRSGIFGRFLNVGKCRSEVAGDVISGVAVDYAGVYVRAAFGVLFIACALLVSQCHLLELSRIPRLSKRLPSSWLRRNGGIHIHVWFVKGEIWASLTYFLPNWWTECCQLFFLLWRICCFLDFTTSCFTQNLSCFMQMKTSWKHDSLTINYNYYSVLELIKRNFSNLSHEALKPWSHLEYAVQVWNPYEKEYIEK